MSADAAYLDSSAFVKLVMPEPESPALRAYLGSWARHISAVTLRTEVFRATMRAAPDRMPLARTLLHEVHLIAVDAELTDVAGTLLPPGLRSLDALHIAASLTVGSDLGTLVTYDERMAQAARLYGLPVAAPS